MYGAVLLSLLAEDDEELHLISDLQLREVAARHHRVHVEEHTVTAAPLGLVGQETILQGGRGGGREGGREEGGRERREEGGREGGGEGGEGEDGRRRQNLSVLFCMIIIYTST